MKKVFFALIFGCLFGNFSTVLAQDIRKYEEECLSFVDSPKVNVTSSYGRLRYDYSKDETFLRQKTAERFEKTGGDLSDLFKPVGLTKVDDQLEVNILVSQINISNGYTCFYPESIEIYWGFLNPVIYILNSLEKGSCLYNLALMHEKTHLEIYIEGLDYFLPQLKKTAEGLYSEVGVKVVKRNQAGAEAAQELNQTYLSVVEKKVDGWRKEIEAEQLKLDSPENYILETKLCEEIDKKNKVSF